MTAPPLASVIIPTWDRPAELIRALQALRLQRTGPFEVIVVGDRPAFAGYDPPAGLPAPTVYARADEANISRSRNIGLALARAPLAAFLDDDAIPEPDWLEALLRPLLAHPEVASAVGFVRDRTGLRIDSAGALVDLYGDEIALDPDEDDGEFSVVPPMDGMALKTFGANCAFRISALADVGGFDEAIRFFLDEADVDLRLARAGWSAALAPAAEIIHTCAPGLYREPNNAPTDLFEIGASKAFFCRKHGGDRDAADASMAVFRQERRRRIERLKAQGRLTGDRAVWLARRLDDGLRDGWTRRSRQVTFDGEGEGEGEGGGGRRAADWPASIRPRVAVLAAQTWTGPGRAIAGRLTQAGAEVTFIHAPPAPRAGRIVFEAGHWSHRCLTTATTPASAWRACFDELERSHARRRFQVVLRPQRRPSMPSLDDAAPLTGRARGFVAEPFDDVDEQILRAVAAAAA